MLCKKDYTRDRITLFMPKWYRPRIMWSWYKGSPWWWRFRHGTFASFSCEYYKCIRVFAIGFIWNRFELEDLIEAYEKGKPYNLDKYIISHYNDKRYDEEVEKHLRIYDRYKRYVDYIRSKQKEVKG